MSILPTSEIIQSEVTRVMLQIEAEMKSSRLGLYGLAEVARHEKVINHTTYIAECAVALGEKYGDAAMHLLFQQWDGGIVDAGDQPVI